ncbi:hypothetical protein CcaverHIS002_0302300 [Cutaneotrichosporon cavernicola]|nr:hypothetical protein CcaverHIS002_0302300 [Cutaneotrichosporon cavernicola]
MIPVFDDIINLSAPAPHSCQRRSHEPRKATKPDDMQFKETSVGEDWPVEEDDDNWATQDEYWDPEEEAEDGDEVEEQGEEGGGEGDTENSSDNNRLVRYPNQGEEGAAIGGQWAANTDYDEDEWHGL